MNPMATPNTLVATRPIALELFRSDGAARKIALVASGTLVTALGAQLSIHTVPVPLTLQTLAVLLAGLALGPRLGAMSQIAYLGLGACGLPVFQSWTGGPAALLGPTGGYLWAFPFAAFVAGYLAEKGWDRFVVTSVAAMLIAQILILLCGTVWLSVYVGSMKAALISGFVPFVGPELVKALAVAFLMPGVWKMLKTPK